MWTLLTGDFRAGAVAALVFGRVILELSISVLVTVCEHVKLSDSGPDVLAM